MATYAETVERILDDLTRPEDELGAIARREVLSAINFYSAKRFGFNERLLSVSLSLTRDYTFAQLVTPHSLSIADLWAIDDLKVGYSNRSIHVAPEHWGSLFRLDEANQTQQFPDCWAIFNKTLRVYPTPSTTLSAVITAHVKFTELLDDGDENPWLVEGEELIRSRACNMIARRKLKAFDRAEHYEKLERQAYMQLLEEANVLQTTGRLAANW